MISPGLGSYEVVLANQYYLRDLVEGITLDESLAEIAYRADIDLVITPDFPAVGPGQEIRVSGIPFGGGEMKYLLQPGVIWECYSRTGGQKHLHVTAYDAAIYLAKSEDEYLLPAGQTATQRLKKYAADWDIPLGAVEETGIPLPKAVYRAQSIWSMIMRDLRQTVTKGGEMYRPRMTPGGLELVRIGGNEQVWLLETNQNVREIGQQRTLEGSVTRVKVLGNASGGQRSPVLAIVDGDTGNYGTLQKVLNDGTITDADAAKKAGEKLLAGLQETFAVTGLDINTIRAGDKVNLNGLELVAASVRHELGSPGRMTLELAGWDYIRRRYYA